jgi:hypothetical protein
MARYGQTYLSCVVLPGKRDRDIQPSESSPRPRFLGIRTLQVSMSCPARQLHSMLTSGLSPFPRHIQVHSRFPEKDSNFGPTRQRKPGLTASVELRNRRWTRCVIRVLNLYSGWTPIVSVCFSNGKNEIHANSCSGCVSDSYGPG